MISEGSCESS